MTIRISPDSLDWTKAHRAANVRSCNKLLALLIEHHGNGEQAGVAPPVEPDQIIHDDPEPVTEASPRSNIWFSVLSEKPSDFISLADIRDAVCQHFGIGYPELCMRRRRKLIVYRRSIAIYLARELTTKSWPQIARTFGGLDHTSAMAAASRIDRALTGADASNTTKSDLDAIRGALGRAE